MEVHRKLEDCALVTKLTNNCIEILQNEITNANDENRVRSAYESLLEIYMQAKETDKKWLELFKETFEIALADRGGRDHVKKFNKYLKILNHLKRWPLLLKRCDEMINLYRKEYVPLELICRVYAETFEDNEFTFEVNVKMQFDITYLSLVYSHIHLSFCVGLHSMWCGKIRR